MSNEIEIYGQGRRGGSPYDRLKRLERENYIDPAKVPVNVHYSTAAGSDPATIQKIGDALSKNMPFGLKCERSRIVFIPHKLKAYWIWSDDEHGPVFQYTDRHDLINGIKVQYLSHKEFIPTAELAALAKIILYSKALENVEDWERKILSQPGLPAGPLATGDGGIQ